MTRRRVRSYVPLWCKTNYSFLEGASHPHELVTAAAGLGLPAVAVTDRDGVYGIVRAQVEAKAWGVKLLVGSELSVGDTGTVLLLALNAVGYRNLCGLISRGRLRRPKGESELRLEDVCSSPGGLAAVGLPGTKEAAYGPLAEAFGERLSVALVRHRIPEDLGRERAARRAGARYGRPLVAVREVLYHDRRRRPLQDVVTAIRHRCSLDEAGTRLKPNDEFGLLDAAAFTDLYADAPGTVERGLEIAAAASFSLDELVYRYPEEEVPAGYTTAGWLRKLTLEGAARRYRGGPPAGVIAQLEKELALIEELEYAGYFLTMWELVDFCAKKGILCQGRGSAANSAVCYCLGITAVDPVRMDLLFERFLSRERAEPPDIDLDIEHHRREEVIAHMYERHGRDRAAMVANVVRYRPKSALRDVGKALGLSPLVLERCARLVARWWEDPKTALASAIEEAGLDSGSKAIGLLFDLASEILEFPRHLSIHPGGFILGSVPLDHLVPVENAAMPGRTVIQWDKYDVEELGLFKVDLLGLGALTVMDYCFRLLAKHKGLDLSLATIPAEDPAVFEMVRRADTIGVFQIESRAQMAMLPRLRPENFYDLVVEVSIVRPGPIVGGMVHPYLRRRHGEEAVEYYHPSLEPVLKKTLGVPLFQEQVMKLAVVAADYTPGEADQLRRDMAAWRRSGRIEKHKDRMVDRMAAKGIPEDFSFRIFDQIRGFGEYGFPESHAASFALLAYATAFMKRHHPEVFTCALLNAWPMGFYAPSTLVDDARRHDIRILPIDVLRSDWDCTLERRAGGLAVRVGLRYVKGLGEADWERIRQARRAVSAPRAVSTSLRGGLAADGSGGNVSAAGGRPAAGSGAFEDFRRAAGLDAEALRVLSEAGAFRCFGIRRRAALWRVLDRLGSPRSDGLPLAAAEAPIGFQDLDRREAVLWDMRASLHSTLDHPLGTIREDLSRAGLPSARLVAGLRAGEAVSYVGMVICRQMPENAKGVMFLTLEDETGFVNLVVWKKVFQKFRRVILASPILGVGGRVQSSEGVVHLVADRFWTPRLSRPLTGPASRDFQ